MKFKKLDFLAVLSKIPQGNLYDPKFNECLIGITEDNNPVYHFFRLLDILYREIYQEDLQFIRDNEITFSVIMEEGYSRIEIMETTFHTNLGAPIICKDAKFLTQTYNNLSEGSWSEFVN